MKLIEAFKTHLTVLGYGDGTIYKATHQVAEFIEIMDKKPEAVTRKDILFYHHYLQHRPNKRRAGSLSEISVKHHLYALKLLFTWLLEKGAIKRHPMSGLTFAKPKVRERVVLSKAEVMKLYRACLGYRERALLSIYYGCGLRRSEGERLNVGDIDFASKLLYVRDGKGQKRRVVPMGRKVRRDLENYLKYERSNTGTTPAFLLNKQESRMLGDSCNGLLKQITGRTAVSREVSLHILRHSIATHLLESGLSLEYVRDFLGHKHLESTQIYTHLQSHQLWNL